MSPSLNTVMPSYIVSLQLRATPHYYDMTESTGARHTIRIFIKSNYVQLYADAMLSALIILYIDKQATKLNFRLSGICLYYEIVHQSPYSM